MSDEISNVSYRVAFALREPDGAVSALREPMKALSRALTYRLWHIAKLDTISFPRSTSKPFDQETFLDVQRALDQIRAVAETLESRDLVEAAYSFLQYTQLAIAATDQHAVWGGYGPILVKELGRGIDTIAAIMWPPEDPGDAI